MLAHSVFFSLHDNSPAAIKKLVDACKTYLPDHAGVLYFAVGTLNPELDRPVNDRDFDVAL
ncbi:MAG TPA: Dabb family protein, partial [Isosphaeraceae bacterium]|nr:Dabb family protein [Isosphaeraceae bacterium]